MKYVLKLNFDETETIFFENEGDNLLSINLSVEPNKKITNEYIFNLFKKYLKLSKDIKILNDTSDVKLIKAFLKNKVDILSDTVGFVLPSESIVSSYLKEQECFKGKKIYLDEIFDVSKSELERVLKIVGNRRDVYVKVDGNSEYITIIEFEKSVNVINNMVEKIKKYNLSPFEQIIYAYDLVRERIYKFEDKGDSPTKSRDLTSVLLGEKIVCVGYAAMLKAILKNFKINIENYIIDSKTKNLAHQRNMIHVWDLKYNLDGVFFFDATFDSRKSENDTSYLNNYLNFAVSKERSENKLDDYVSRTLPNFDRYFIPKLKEIILESGVKSVPKDMINTINRVSIFLDKKFIINNLMFYDLEDIPEIVKEKYGFSEKKMFEDLDRYQRLFFDSKIKGESFLRALYNVRRVEYYEEPSKYPFDIESIETSVRSIPNDINKKLLYAIFGNPDEKINEQDFHEVLEKDKILENIEKVKITNLVRNYHERKKDK